MYREKAFTLVEHEHFACMLTVYISFLGLLAAIKISRLYSTEQSSTNDGGIRSHGTRTIVRGISP